MNMMSYDPLDRNCLDLWLTLYILLYANNRLRRAQTPLGPMRFLNPAICSLQLKHAERAEELTVRLKEAGVTHVHPCSGGLRLCNASDLDEL